MAYESPEEGTLRASLNDQPFVPNPNSVASPFTIIASFFWN